MDGLERRIYFYQLEMEDGGQWQRADVLRRLDALQDDDLLLALGGDAFAWALVDRIPTGQQSGRLRLFRERRANLPGFSTGSQVAELPIPDTSGLVEPTHVVLAGDGLIAAEYNHFAPRIPTQFAQLLRSKLGLSLTIKTYVQGSIIEQLDRLDYINLFEASIAPGPGLEELLTDSGPIGSAAADLADAGTNRRVHLRLSSDRGDDDFTSNVRAFARRVLPFGGSKVLRVEGFDPIVNADQVVDLLSQKLVRVQDFERPNTRSKVLDRTAAYQHIEQAIADVRGNDLQTAALI